MGKLPPLNSLRVFEAAGRHGSFKLAAEELCVTQGAVSRHIVKLESFIGAQLFLRRHRQVELTPVGRKYLSQIREGFRHINDATASVVSESRQDMLKIKVPPTFAIRWLVPRMPKFQARYPNTSIQMSTPFDIGIFEHDLDLAVSYGTRISPNLVREPLLAELLTPIISSRLAAAPRHDPADVGEFALLHSMTRPNDWRRWLEVAGVTRVDPDNGLRFENCGLVYQAVAEGLGAGIAQLTFVTDELAAGRFVAPVPVCVRNDTGYYLVYPPDRMNNVVARDFRDWIHAEAGASSREAAARCLGETPDHACAHGGTERAIAGA